MVLDTPWQGRGEQWRSRTCSHELGSERDLPAIYIDIVGWRASECRHVFAVIAVGGTRQCGTYGRSSGIAQQLGGLQSVPHSQTDANGHIRFHIGADLTKRILRAGD